MKPYRKGDWICRKGSKGQYGCWDVFYQNTWDGNFPTLAEAKKHINKGEPKYKWTTKEEMGEI